MRKAEARDLVRKMVLWHMIHNGFPGEGEPIEATLEDMLAANRMVEKENNNPLKPKSKRVKTMPTLDDRAIAALYVAMSYQGDDVSNGSSICEYQNNFVVVIKHIPKDGD